MNENLNDQIYYNGYLNLLNISKYANAFEILRHNSSIPILSSSFIPDLRYSWNVPMLQIYPLVESNVLEAKK